MGIVWVCATFFLQQLRIELAINLKNHFVQVYVVVLSLTEVHTMVLRVNMPAHELDVNSVNAQECLLPVLCFSNKALDPSQLENGILALSHFAVVLIYFRASNSLWMK